MPSGPLQRLSTSHHLPMIGASIWVNHPRHDGDTPLHDHDFLEIALVTAGHALHRTIHGERPIRTGDLLVLHPGQWHAYERCRGLQLYNCCIGAGLLANELAWIRSDPYLKCLVLPSAMRGGSQTGKEVGQDAAMLHLTTKELDACMKELERIRVLQMAATPIQARAETVARVLILLSCYAQRITASKAMMHEVHGTLPAAVTTICRAMEERLDHAWGLPELALMAAMTRFQLLRLFRHHLGCPPMAWLMRRRVEKAAVLLLTTDQSMAAVGQQVGWSDANYFSRRFRAAFGRSPRQYRAQLPLPAVVRTASDWVQWQ